MNDTESSLNPHRLDARVHNRINLFILDIRCAKQESVENSPMGSVVPSSILFEVDEVVSRSIPERLVVALAPLVDRDGFSRDD
jgi:hypothetical protein